MHFTARPAFSFALDQSLSGESHVKQVGMKNLSSILFSLLMAVCLTLYGPFAMANTDGGGFMTEICAGDVVITVFIGADGAPVEQSQDCPECLTCCHVAVFQTPATCGAAAFKMLLTLDADCSSAQNPLLNKRNILPAPRGPPALQVFKQCSPNLIGFQQATFGDKMRSDGRPLLKDATA